jgi:hypothetical protein
MNSEDLLSTSSLRRACTLGIVLSVAILATNAEALPEPKVLITYSLETVDGGAYWQKISPDAGIGNVEYVVDVVDSLDENVDVLMDNPLIVAIEFTADAPGGNIVDGPVEFLGTHFEREFTVNVEGLTLVHTRLSTRLSRRGTGSLSGSTITWDNVVGVNAYQEKVVGLATCTGFACGFVSVPFPRDLSGINEVPLPTFSVFTNTTFGDAFASDNGTPTDPTDDIDRPDPDATVTDTWEGVEVPEPSREVLLLAGALGLAGLSRLRGRSGASA